MRAVFLNLESDFPIQNSQEHIAWAISYRATIRA